MSTASQSRKTRRYPVVGTGMGRGGYNLRVAGEASFTWLWLWVVKITAHICWEFTMCQSYLGSLTSSSQQPSKMSWVRVKVFNNQYVTDTEQPDNMSLIQPLANWCRSAWYWVPLLCPMNRQGKWIHRCGGHHLQIIQPAILPWTVQWECQVIYLKRSLQRDSGNSLCKGKTGNLWIYYHTVGERTLS